MPSTKPSGISGAKIASTSPLIAQMGEDWIVVRDGEGVAVTWRIAARATTLGRPLTPMLRASALAMFVMAKSGRAKRTAWSEGRVRGTQAV